MGVAQGILPGQAIEDLVRERVIRVETPLAETQIQPASLDLRLGRKAYRDRKSVV